MKPEIPVSNDFQAILASEQNRDFLGWNAFLEELEAQVAVDRANDPEGMAALETEWSAQIEEARAKADRRNQDQLQHTRELGRLRAARFRARKKAKQRALCKRQEMVSFMESWEGLPYQQQEETVDAFHLIIESMAEEVQALERESIPTKRRTRRNARHAPVMGRPALVR
jgi:hypothetical protein